VEVLRSQTAGLFFATLLLLASSPAIAAGCPGVRATMAQADAASSAADDQRAGYLYQQAIEALELCTNDLSSGSGVLYVTYQALEAVAAISAAAISHDAGDTTRTSELMLTAWKSIFNVCTSDRNDYVRLSFSDETAFYIRAYVTYPYFAKRVPNASTPIDGCRAANIAPASPSP